MKIISSKYTKKYYEELIWEKYFDFSIIWGNEEKERDYELMKKMYGSYKIISVTKPGEGHYKIIYENHK